MVQLQTNSVLQNSLAKLFSVPITLRWEQTEALMHRAC